MQEDVRGRNERRNVDRRERRWGWREAILARGEELGNGGGEGDKTKDSKEARNQGRKGVVFQNFRNSRTLVESRVDWIDGYQRIKGNKIELIGEVFGLVSRRWLSNH